MLDNSSPSPSPPTRVKWITRYWPYTATGVLGWEAGCLARGSWSRKRRGGECWSGFVPSLSRVVSPLAVAPRLLASSSASRLEQEGPCGDRGERGQIKSREAAKEDQPRAQALGKKSKQEQALKGRHAPSRLASFSRRPFPDAGLLASFRAVERYAQKYFSSNSSSFFFNNDTSSSSNDRLRWCRSW